ncbi:helix-turn-helix transcriptional regulator [Streptomyces sp. ST2-7A]|uniref:helix-turn-helix domain-containing protein n=1 Tax=Streptomyces sp. ST2-7A TaxID=2907214 RepID=UPI001F448EF4|nr:helix-turn-helix transcriptional regulator [Streptomyces sp. ST2-7A]MCE7082092.1 helix-turn-helix transcriptional regulator [Streptomyces sp. ST2-7A]
MAPLATSGEPEPSDSLRTFGAVLKTFRERAGLTQEQLAPLLGYAPPTVAAVEQGRRLPQRDFIDKAEEVLDAFGTLRAAARHLSRRPGLAAWFREWARLEEEALNLWTYECRVIPGLLQSEGYARTIFENSVPPPDDEHVQRQVTARLARQQLPTKWPNTGYSFIIEEALFLRRVGGTEVTRILIDHVLACASQRNVEIQIMPLVREQHSGDVGPLRLLESSDNRWLAYSEGPRGGYLFTDPKDVGEMLQIYAKMRSQALTPRDSLSLLERLRGES